MKNKLITLSLTFCLLLSISACGSGNTEQPQQTSTPESQASQASNDLEKTPNADTEVEVETETESADDGVINFDGEGFNVTYLRHEMSEDYEGNPCVIFYYNFTNNGEENTSATVATSFKAFQNGIQCETAILMDAPEVYDNSMKEIQPGATIEACQAFSVSDTSDVQIEVSSFLSFDDAKDVQVLTLE